MLSKKALELLNLGEEKNHSRQKDVVIIFKNISYFCNDNYFPFSMTAKWRKIPNPQLYNNKKIQVKIHNLIKYFPLNLSSLMLGIFNRILCSTKSYRSIKHIPVNFSFNQYLPSNYISKNLLLFLPLLQLKIWPMMLSRNESWCFQNQSVEYKNFK